MNINPLDEITIMEQDSQPVIIRKMLTVINHSAALICSYTGRMKSEDGILSNKLAANIFEQSRILLGVYNNNDTLNKDK